MSIDNAKSLFDRINQDSTLQARVAEITPGTPAEAAEKLSKLSQELKIPATPEEILAVGQLDPSTLSDTELEAVSGGWGLIQKGPKIKNPSDS